MANVGLLVGIGPIKAVADSSGTHVTTISLPWSLTAYSFGITSPKATDSSAVDTTELIAAFILGKPAGLTGITRTLGTV